MRVAAKTHSHYRPRRPATPKFDNRLRPLHPLARSVAFICRPPGPPTIACPSSPQDAGAHWFGRIPIFIDPLARGIFDEPQTTPPR